MPSKEQLEQRLAELLSKRALTEEDCWEISGNRLAREITFSERTRLPPTAFSVPNRSTEFLTIPKAQVLREHLTDLAQWPRLLTLNLADCEIDEAALAVLNAAPKLTDLWLEGTNLTDKGLPEAGKLTNLRWLNVGRTRVTDAGLESITNLKELRVLWVNETSVTDEGILRLVCLPRIFRHELQRLQRDRGRTRRIFQGSANTSDALAPSRTKIRAPSHERSGGNRSGQSRASGIRRRHG